jgi:hypothetical protein
MSGPLIGTERDLTLRSLARGSSAGLIYVNPAVRLGERLHLLNLARTFDAAHGPVMALRRYSRMRGLVPLLGGKADMIDLWVQPLCR